jgi:HTH-type transcriptional regulator, competence development regulator
MNKDTAIAELFFRFRIAKRLLQIDHPTCGCGKPSIGVHQTLGSEAKKIVDARCEDHWFTEKNPLRWAVRWDEMEDAAEMNSLEDETQMNTTFGQQLRTLRKERGLNQRDLAAQIDVDFSYISKIENGQMPPPSLQLIQRIAQVLEDDEHTLLNLAGKVPSGIAEAMHNNPLLTELIHLLSSKRLSDETYRQLLQIAREDQSPQH